MANNIYTDNLTQTVTHWAASPAGDVYGEGWATPVTVAARVVQGTFDVVGDDGSRVVATAKVYHRQTGLAAGDFIAVGSKDAVTPLATPGALRVFRATATPNLPGDGVLYVAYAGKG